MSILSRIRDRIRGSKNEWMQAEGVLPVERALADEHEAMHGPSITAALENVQLEFDAAQFTDIPAIARDLRSALGTESAGASTGRKSRHKLDSDLTPRDAAGKFLLEDAALKAGLFAYEALGDHDRKPPSDHARPLADDEFAAALAESFNRRLGERLVDEDVFRPFVRAGAVDALGEPPSGSSDTAAQELFARRANRELLEAVFPRMITLMRDRRLAVVFDAARERDTAALCLSGGGIRSSTFGLGIMQGLARHGLLGKFDYLSTVSGGGLSGGWLSAWMRRAGSNAVHEALRHPGRERLQPEPDPVQGLRSFSSWLTPNAGAMSIDSWTVIATIFRNILLNWLVLLPLLAGVVMLPRLLLAVLAIDFGDRPDNPWWVIGSLLGGFGLTLVASLYIDWVRASGDDVAEGRRSAPTQARVLVFFLAPLFTGSMIIVVALWIGVTWGFDGEAYASLATVAALLALVFVTAVALIRPGGHSRWKSLGRAAKVFVSGLVGYTLAMLVLAAMSNWEDEWLRNLYMTLGPAVVLLGSVLTSQLYTGLTSNEAGDAEREWAARANAWVLIASIGWMVASGLVLLGPTLAGTLWQKATLLGVGGISSWITIFLSKRTQDSRSGPPKAGVQLGSMALSLAMPAVVACLIIGLAASNDESINRVCTGEKLQALFECTPPGGNSPEFVSAADSTSAPMLETVAKANLLQAYAATQQFTGLLRQYQYPISHLEDSSAAIRHENEIMAASHLVTEFALAIDSVERRRVRRLGVLSPEFQTMKNMDGAIFESVRKFTASRNRFLANHMPADTVILTNAEPDSVLQRIPADVLRQTHLFLATRAAINAEMKRRADDTLSLHEVSDSVLRVKAHPQPGNKALWIGVLLLMSLMIGTGLFFSTVVNTNTFSLHAMWKARTVRAFLGTTREEAGRNPNPFTGFDSDDDVSLRDLWPARVSQAEAEHPAERSESVPPMHVLNVTLNLAAGRNLAWQQRKGESMTLTSLHAGSAFTGYRRMEPYANPGVPSPSSKPGYGGADGVSLGTAMAISGAAASPNDGAGTSALGAFLMTFFNARLGWWLGNPGAPGADTWQRSAPAQRLTPILSEMLGLTSDRSQYVYLSDGGHFENLAMYEMVFRRCRFIVVSDAGADPNYTFEDLGNAVRKCRIDFGIPIDFGAGIKIQSGDGSKGAYWATARIRYSAVDMPKGKNPDDYDGVLIYVKPAVYGNEPRDVVNYSKLSPTFPQESSADQFFTESQFESYRELGSWIIDQLVADPGGPGEPVVVHGLRKGSLLRAWPNLGG
jgi:Patatin-like phospholipase